jgi:hypothetical protein
MGSIDPDVLMKLREYIKKNDIDMKIIDIANIYKIAIKNHATIKAKRIVDRFKQIKDSGEKGICGEVRTIKDEITGEMKQVPRKGTHYNTKIKRYHNTIIEMLRQGAKQVDISRRIGVSTACISAYIKRHDLKVHMPYPTRVNVKKSRFSQDESKKNLQEESEDLEDVDSSPVLDKMEQQRENSREVAHSAPEDPLGVHPHQDNYAV